MSSQQSGLVGFLFPSGKVWCVDCDIYPPGTVAVYKAEAGNDQCGLCGQRLTDVDPVGGQNHA